MNAAADRLEFAPPPPPGFLRAVVLAVIAHLLLLLALTWGVHWKRDAETLSADAELWSAVPQQAAPKLVEAPPQPVQPPTPAQVAPPPVPVNRDADIAIEREKKRKAEEARLQQQEIERQKLAEQKKREAEKREAERLAAQREAKAQKAAEDRKRAEALAAAKPKAPPQPKEDPKRTEALRQENIRRMAGLAGATGGETATGNALRSSGPSDSYAGRIRARIRPNIVFTENTAGNPVAEVEVRLAPDGTIVGVRLAKPSGVKSWDDAVLRAIDKTEVLPRDIDGRVHSPMIIALRPKDL